MLNVVDCSACRDMCDTGRTLLGCAFVMAALDLRGRGSGKLVLRDAPEVHLSVEVRAHRKETIVERSLAGSHQSVGTVESANRGLAGQIRAMSISLKERLQARVPT